MTERKPSSTFLVENETNFYLEKLLVSVQ